MNVHGLKLWKNINADMQDTAEKKKDKKKIYICDRKPSVDFLWGN